MIFNEIKCHVNTSLGLVGGMHPPCVRAWFSVATSEEIFVDIANGLIVFVVYFR